jgi:CubicO group peptidase (beta-lactamase class C family)
MNIKVRCFASFNASGACIGIVRCAATALILLAIPFASTPPALAAAAETAEARPATEAQLAASQKADALLRGLIETNDPGLAVLVAQDGKILFEKCYGLADREHHVPVMPQTTFRIGSIGKQFTAAAILKLQEKGKLSVNDKLSKYIPDFPRGDEVTLRHLLTHTSGIHSYTEKQGFIQGVTSAVKPDDLVNSFKNDPYDFDPGKKWHYNNSGYFLLGRIVEKVSGQSYGDFLQKNFFQPLGMTNTGVYRAHPGLPHEALGYSLEGEDFTNAVNWDMSWAGGAGTLYSTVEDLFRWNEGIFNGRVLDGASLKLAFTSVKVFENQLNSDSGYGFGWFIGRHHGLWEISHGGGLNGFLSFLLRVPDETFTVAVLANASPGRTNAIPLVLARQLVDIYLADKLAPVPNVNTNVSPKSYDALTGRYDSGIQGVIVTISRRGTHLFAQTANGPEMGPEEEIFPKSDTEFFSKFGGQITFLKDRSGKVVKIIGQSDGSATLWPGMVLFAPRMNEVVEEK